MHAKKAAPTRAAPGLGGESRLGTRKGTALTGGSRASATEGRRESGVGGLGRAGLDWAEARFWATGRKRRREREKGRWAGWAES